MEKSLTAGIRIFFVLVMLPLMAALTGCRHTDPEDPNDFSVKSFSVSGTVYDSSESFPGDPLSDITITMSVYWHFDTERETPIRTEVVRSGADGKYQIYKQWNMPMQNVFYVLKVTDDSKLRTVHFKPVEQELYLRSHTDAYDDVMMSYEVKDNDFHLYPEGS